MYVYITVERYTMLVASSIMGWTLFLVTLFALLWVLSREDRR